MKSLGDVRPPDGVGAFEIRDGPGNTAQAIEAAPGQTQSGHCPFDQGETGGIENAMLLECVAGQVGVRPSGSGSITRRLPLARLLHPGADRRGRFAGLITRERLEGYRVHSDRQIDSIAQRSRDPSAIVPQLGRVAEATSRQFAGVATGTGVHRADQEESGGKPYGPGRTRDANHAFLERRAQRLECAPVEFCHLVEEQHAGVRKA